MVEISRIEERSKVVSAVKTDRIEWQRHALVRMAERGVRRAQVLHVIMKGEEMESYPEDHPYPSALFFGQVDGRPLHVVAAWDGEKVYVITTYEPSLEYWERDFRKRKRT